MLSKDYMPQPMLDSSFPIYIEKQSFTHSGSLFPIHWHEQLEFIFVTKGDFYMNIKNQLVKGHEGQLLCINPNEIHHVQSHSKFTEYYCVIIDPRFLSTGVLDQCEQTIYTPLWTSSISFNTVINSPRCIHLFHQLIQEKQLKQDGYELAIKGLSHLLVSQLYRDELSEHYQSSVVSKTEPEHVRQLLTIIHDSYKEDLTLSYLSKQLHLESTYLSHIFKNVTGTSIGAYIKKYRLKMGQNKLETTSKSIETIALSCGFNSINYFSRAFKQQYLMTPNQYRKKSEASLKASLKSIKFN